MTKIYIENCFCLTAKRVDNSLDGIRIKKIGDNSDFERKDIKYKYEDTDSGSFLRVVIEDHGAQIIKIDPFETQWGERNYFICEKCQTRHTKLYLKPGGDVFLCKECHGISYETFNPLSPQGRFLKRVKKVLKLVERQAEMTSRIWYREVYTERYENFLADCEKVGLTEIVADARALESAVKANRLKNKTNSVV